MAASEDIPFGVLQQIQPDADARAAQESALIEQARRDPEAFGRLFELHYAAVLNYAYRRVVDVDQAEDIAANTFFKALRALPKYRRTASFRTWLLGIATNEIRMAWRASSRRRAFHGKAFSEEELARLRFGPEYPPDLGQQQEDMLRFIRLHKALSALPERYQTILTLRYFEDLSLREISAALGKREGTVKSMIHRGLKRLKKIMEKTQPS